MALPGQYVQPGHFIDWSGLAQIYMQAQQNKQRQVESEAQQAQAQAQESRLREQQQYERQQAQTEKTQAVAGQRAIATDRARANMAKVIEADPSRAPMLQRIVDENARAGRWDHFELPGAGAATLDPASMAHGQTPGAYPGAVQQFADAAQAALAARGEGPKPLEPSPLAIKAAELSGTQPGTPEHRKAMAKLIEDERAAAIRERVAGRSSTNVNVSSGNAGLEKSTRGKLEVAQTDDEMVLAKLDDIKSYGDPSRFLGLKSKVKNYALSALAGLDESLLDAEQMKQVADARQFKEDVESTYLAAKVDITGASGGEKELREIRNAVLSTDMSAPEFRASLGKLERVTRRNMDIRRRLLSQGIDVKSAEGKKALSEEIDRARSQEAGAASTSVNQPVIDQLDAEFGGP